MTVIIGADELDAAREVLRPLKEKGLLFSFRHLPKIDAIEVCVAYESGEDIEPGFAFGIGRLFEIAYSLRRDNQVKEMLNKHLTSKTI